MSDEPETKTFRVKDRRRFDAEGNVRPRDPDEDEAAPVQETSRPAPDVPPRRPAPDVPSGRASSRRPTEPPPRTAPSGPPPAGGPTGTIGFADLVMSVSTTALAYLGHEPGEPGRVPAQVNLRLASQNIDILAMLQQKTKGNLSREEEELINTLLYELRTIYVDVAKSVSGASGPGLE
ncbi:MAG: DUF1844 domain-containing protein [Myxococcota bacterium]